MSQTLDSIYATGWLPYAGDDVLHPEPGHIAGRKGFLHYGENVYLGKSPVYDAPNGKIVGYAYAGLGYVSLADDPTFDLHAQRLAKFGCDPVNDASCKPPSPGGR